MNELVKWAYETMELDEYADEKQLKHQYRILCKRYHPDGNNSDINLQSYYRVQQAYQIVSQVIRNRKSYSAVYSGYGVKGTDKNPYFTGKVIGNNPQVHSNYKKMQQRMNENARLKEWEEAARKKKERKKNEDSEKMLKSRKLPSQTEREKLEKVKKHMEAERIAEIISVLLESNT